MRLDVRVSFAAGWVALCIAAPLSAQKPAAKCERIQVRLVTETPSPAVRRYTDPVTRVAYGITDTVALETKAIESLEKEAFADAPGDTLWSILSHLRPSAVPRVSRFFNQYRDRYIAVLIGSDVIQTAVIAGPIHDILPLRIQTSRVVVDSLMHRLQNAIGPTCSA